MLAKKTWVKEVTTHLVHLGGALSRQGGDISGELLAEWAVSSPHARRQFAVAVRLTQPSCVRDVQREAITKYASEVLPPDECCELILNLCAPKSAWRTLSEVYTLGGLKCTAATGLPFACPICPERAFQQRWEELLAPLELEPPGSTSDPRAIGVSWPWALWLHYIASQSPFCRMIDWSFLLTFIVKGDGYPCACGEWSQLSVSIVDMGLWGRIRACVWVIRLAICGDKQMAPLATWIAEWCRKLLNMLLIHRFGIDPTQSARAISHNLAALHGGYCARPSAFIRITHVACLTHNLTCRYSTQEFYTPAHPNTKKNTRVAKRQKESDDTTKSTLQHAVKGQVPMPEALDETMLCLHNGMLVANIVRALDAQNNSSLTARSYPGDPKCKVFWPRGIPEGRYT